MIKGISKTRIEQIEGVKKGEESKMILRFLPLATTEVGRTHRIRK